MLGVDDGIRQHKVQINFATGIVWIGCRLHSTINICCQRMGAIMDLARESVEKRVQIGLVVELKFRLKDAERVLGVRGCSLGNLVQCRDTSWGDGIITDT